MKLSPMLDWHKAVDDLMHAHGATWGVEVVHIVAVQNECKEMVVVIGTPQPKLQIKCISFLGKQSPYTSSSLFEFDENEAENAHFVETESVSPSLFLYEPHAAVMKAGCFALLCKRFQVSTLARDSHLFVADRLIEDFPGRKFRIAAVSTMNKRELATKMKGIDKANITVRNFPMGVAQLRKRLKLKDGGDDYLFATTLADGSHVLIIAKKAG